MAFIQFLAFIQFTKCRRIYSHINNIKPYPTLIFCSRMLTWRECTRYLTVLLATRDTFCALNSKTLLGSKVQIFIFWTWKIFFVGILDRNWPEIVWELPDCDLIMTRVIFSWHFDVTAELWIWIRPKSVKVWTVFTE